MQRFIGTFVSDEMLSNITLAAEVLGVSRSAAIRTALQDYLDSLSSRGKKTLAYRLASKLEAQWRQDAVHDDLQDWKCFCEDTTKKLESKGLTPKMVAVVIEEMCSVRIHLEKI